MTLLSIALEPHTSDDGERLAQALRQLTSEDPSLSVTSDSDTGRFVVGGMSESQLDVVTARLRDEFHVGAWVGPPTIAFKEVLTQPADGAMKYAKQTGGRAQYAQVKIRVHPGEPGIGYVFVNEAGATIPPEFIPSIDDGIRDALAHGPLAGYPTENVRVALYDGSYHDVDSSPLAFKLAGAMAFQDAAQKAKPVLIEPIVRVQVTVPEEYAGEVISDLESRTDQIALLETAGDSRAVVAQVPLSKMLGYANDLRSRTDGRATHVMQFERYAPCAGFGGDDDLQHRFVGVPQKPAPTLRVSGVSVPEPDPEVTDE